MAESLSHPKPGHSKSHAYTLVHTDGDQAEHWHCQECGRRIRLWWPPNYRREVLVPGDERVRHVAARGGVQMGLARAWPGAELPN